MAITNFTRSWKDLITSVRTLLDEDSAGFYTDDMIFRLLLDAQMRIAQKASVRYEATGKLPKLFRDCAAVYVYSTRKYYESEALFSGTDIYELLSVRVKYVYDAGIGTIDYYGYGEGVEDMIDVPILPPDKFFSENNYIDGACLFNHDKTPNSKAVLFKSNFAGDKHAIPLSFMITYISIWTDYDTKPDFGIDMYDRASYPSSEEDEAGRIIYSNRTKNNLAIGILPPYCYPAMTEYAYASILRRDREMIPFAMQSLARAEKLMEECVG